MNTILIQVPPPFRLEPTVWTLRRRSHNSIDRWDGDRYRRVLILDGKPIEVTVHQRSFGNTPSLHVDLWADGDTVNESRKRAARQTLERMLGVNVDLADFYVLADSEPRLRALAARFYGMRPPCFPTVFEALVNAIACQQLSLTVGIHLLSRLSERYGPSVAVDGRRWNGFPTAESLAEVDPQLLRDLGFSHAKARYVTQLALEVATGALDAEGLRQETDERALALLRRVHGIGRWSAEYVLLRGLQRWNILPGDDVGARNSLRRRFDLSPDAGYEALATLAQLWWPWGGLVYFHLLLDTVGLDTAIYM